MLHYDVLVDKLKNELRARTKKLEDQEKQKEEEKSHIRMGEELKIEKKKLEIQKESYEMRGEIALEERYKNVILPKLIITKFQCTHIDWFHFWNQYEFETIRTELHPVSKFNYLKE